MIYQQRINPLSQFALLIGLVGVGFIAGGIFSILVGKLYLRVPLVSLPDALLDPSNARLSMILQIVATFFAMGVPAIFFAIIVYRKPFSFIGFNTVLSAKQIILTVLIMFAALFASDMFGELNKWIPLPQKMSGYFRELEDNYDKAVVAMTNMKSFSDYVLSLIVIALAPALFEEILFRGCLQQVMISLTKKVFLGILITSVLFSMAHFSYYGFLPRLFLGMALGYIFYYSKNIWLNVLAHFLNNAIGVTQIYLISRQGKLTVDAMNDHFPWYYGVAGILAFYFLFLVFKKESSAVISQKSEIDSNTVNQFG